MRAPFFSQTTRKKRYDRGERQALPRPGAKEKEEGEIEKEQGDVENEKFAGGRIPAVSRTANRRRKINTIPELLGPPRT